MQVREAGDKTLLLRGDETRLKQVLINLVKNAIKFTDSGFIDVKLAYNRNKGVLKGHVRDSGCGIEEHDLGKLFSRFGKLDRTAEINHEGIGIGLTIVEQIVKQFGGDVQVRSNGPGKGSVFSFKMFISMVGVESSNKQSELQKD